MQINLRGLSAWNNWFHSWICISSWSQTSSMSAPAFGSLLKTVVGWMRPIFECDRYLLVPPKAGECPGGGVCVCVGLISNWVQYLHLLECLAWNSAYGFGTHVHTTRTVLGSMLVWVLVFPLWKLYSTWQLLSTRILWVAPHRHLGELVKCFRVSSMLSGLS